MKDAPIEDEIHRLELEIQRIDLIVEGNGDINGLVQEVDNIKEILADLQKKYPIIFYDTTEHWNSHPEIEAKRGAIYIYSDAKSFQGQDIPRFKVGNGDAFLIDLPFMDADIRYILENYTPVSPEDRLRWDNKINLEMRDDTETLIFNRN